MDPWAATALSACNRKVTENGFIVWYNQSNIPLPYELSKFLYGTVSIWSFKEQFAFVLPSQCLETQMWERVEGNNVVCVYFFGIYIGAWLRTSLRELWGNRMSGSVILVQTVMLGFFGSNLDVRLHWCIASAWGQTAWSQRHTHWNWIKCHSLRTYVQAGNSFQFGYWQRALCTYYALGQRGIHLSYTFILLLLQGAYIVFYPNHSVLAITLCKVG